MSDLMDNLNAIWEYAFQSWPKNTVQKHRNDAVSALFRENSEKGACNSEWIKLQLENSKNAVESYCEPISIEMTANNAEGYNNRFEETNYPNFHMSVEQNEEIAFIGRTKPFDGKSTRVLALFNTHKNEMFAVLARRDSENEANLFVTVYKGPCRHLNTRPDGQDAVLEPIAPLIRLMVHP